ncbi:MAG: quinoprotein dehydrogenase-associated SoxYZ-like carrier [Vitreoscilla sp.]|nr:quinoprotein dehydrogenase-associated SoxYZ-like carrier [Burkholderiales bacterium]MBP6336468.1 quinoprotein dehydrogenase-associated SoxYZ-like carrier [Vitreoscilla sp.]MBP6675759.1 quinoprotein dehydrogenase-associated SoxYZ-like carrier [Vitreoscilla sp.]
MLRRHLLLVGGLAWGGSAAALAQAPKASPDDPESSPMWHKLRQQLFEGRSIQMDARISLQAPRRAEDPAFVPLAIHVAPGATPADDIRRLTLLIDNNPTPIAAVVDLPAGGAMADLETRVRVDEYTFVRAVAETADGRVLMATRFVKASGGCSAPAGGDEAAMRAAMGRMLFRLEGAAPTAAGQAMTVQWMVSHPNHSGMAMNQLTRTFTPSEYVRKLHIYQGDRLLLAADVDFALSENPSLRFRFVPQGNAPLRAEVVDTFERRYSAQAALDSLAR